MINKKSPMMMEGTIIAILEDEFLFIPQINISEELLKRTADEWFKSDQMLDLYRLTNIKSDVKVGTEIRILFVIMTMSIPPLVPVMHYKILEDVAGGDELDLRVLEGTIVAVLEDEFLFVPQLNLSEELLKRTADEWFASDQMSNLYRLTGVGSDVNIIGVGTEIRISFAITTASIPPLVPVVDYELIMVDDAAMNELDLCVLEGTVIAVLEDEFLFVPQLNLSKELLKRTADEWFKSDQMLDIHRLTNIKSDISVGCEIRIFFAIMTRSIPPLVPVVRYETI